MENKSSRITRDNVKILVVDESPINIRVITNTLRQAQFKNFYQANNSSKALDKIKIVKDVGLVICDMNMRASSGLELLKSVRRSRDFYDLHFIMLTNGQNKSEIAEAQKIGVKHFVTKPLNPRLIKEKVYEILPSVINKNAIN